MSVFTSAHPQTRSQRAAILRRAPITSPLGEAAMERLLGASEIALCPPGKVLFTAGDSPDKIFLIASGTVQMRVRTGGWAEGPAEPRLHLRLLGPGDVVADRELSCLAAGQVSQAPRRQAAIVLGAPAEIVAIDQAALAAVLAENAAARAAVAEAVTAQIDALERLADELAVLKNFGKARLARLLLAFFARQGVKKAGMVRIPYLFSHAELAVMLGLTRRSVADDMLALEAFDAIDHDSDGHLLLHDRARLARIANLDPSAGRDTDAAAWCLDVQDSLAAGDTLRGLELAREARLYHPRDPELGYLAALAALRSGAPDVAEAVIANFDFSAPEPFSTPERDERMAALAARVLKERAFAAPDRDSLRRIALQSAEAYHAVHRRTKGRYSALNAAAMYCVAGRPETGTTLARALVAGGDRSSYWGLATLAEAHWLLDDAAAAAEWLRQAVQAADADAGKLATTRVQIQLLSTCLGRDATSMQAAFPRRGVMVCTQPPDGEQLAARLGAECAEAFLAITTPDDLARYAALPTLTGATLVLAAPAELLARDVPQAALSLLARTPCHVADPAPGPITPARRHHARRRALGLGLLAAAASATKLTLGAGTRSDAEEWPEWAAPDGLAVGQSAVLWVQPAHDFSIADLAGGVAAVDRVIGAQGAAFSFASVATALAEACRVQARAAASGRDIRLCLDVENLTATPLAAASLLRMQPLTRASEIFASEAAAAELALLRRGGIRLVAVGRPRNQRRFDRMRAWAVTETAIQA